MILFFAPHSSWVRVPRPPQMCSNQGFCFNRIDVLGEAFDAVDGFKTVALDSDSPYLVGERVA